MNRSSKLLLIFGLIVLAISTAPGAYAISTTCVYNPTTQMIEYSISDGVNGQIYEIHLIVDGCITGDTPSTITGPNGSAQVSVSCGSADGFGTARLEICDDIVCFKMYNLYFRCETDCELRYIGDGAPSSTNWSIIIILSIFTVTGAFFARKMFATAK